MLHIENTEFESKRKEKYTHANTNENKSNVVLLSDKIHSIARNSIKDKRFVIIKDQSSLTKNLNVCALFNAISKYISQKK